MRPTRLSPTPPVRHRSGGGFTLVELLVVMMVLAILLALLLPAINGARIRVRHTAVQAEINRIASAIVAFNTKYGSNPPGSITLYETGGANGANWDARSRALIRQLWPQFNFAMNRDINGDGDTNDVITLEAGEVLVFFLGGLPDQSAGPNQFRLLGFSRNPQDPFSRAANANRDKSAYDFDSRRLVDLDNDGFPEFLDSYPGQRNPIVYFSAYDSNGYRLEDYPGNTVMPQDLTIPFTPYLQGDSLSAPPYNPNSFQLISPGQDGDYGPGGPFQEGAIAPFPGWTRATPTSVTVTPTDRAVERDNITNFGNGPLVP
jgi:prepilin-type N-terminal cleavage/methylation domain-containing protein